MSQVFIYWPPGVGKLTFARELAGLTGFKLFHNCAECLNTKKGATSSLPRR